jgi:glutamate:Na+ symporter, ESS family
MKFFADPIILTTLFLGVLFLIAGLLRQLISPLRKYGIPSSIIAGICGLLLCNLAVSILPLSITELKDVLKMIVYHGLALVFIAIGLQQPPKTANSPDAVSMGFAIGSMAALQGLIGVGLTVILGFFFAESIHPGFGLLLPLGYNQGPGQALTFGSSWESSGFENGGDIGLIIAALGFGWSIFVGIPLVIYGKKKGWITSLETQEDQNDETTADTVELGSLDPLTTHISAIAIVYLLVFLILTMLSEILGEKQKLIDMLWGFHFIIGLGLAIVIQKLQPRLSVPQLSNPMLSRVSNFVVDIVTCAALAAIQISVLTANWIPIVTISFVGGICTVVGVLWLASRSFQKCKFHHAVLWFGASTGTLPMGLALLRIIDPDLKSPAPTSATVGSIFALLFSAPLIAIMPYTINQWPDGYPTAAWITLGLLAIYFVVIIGIWRFFGKLHFNGKTLWNTDSTME